jgi:hypothetical protein
MTNPTKLVVNCETGVQENVELTDEEVAEIADREAEHKKRQAEAEIEAQAKAEAKVSALAKLEALGLTEDEVNALVK